MSKALLKEKWIKWEPLNGLSCNYYIESITDNLNGFEIIMIEEQDSNTKLKIKFEASVDAFRDTDESFRSKLLLYLNTNYSDISKWCFFKVENSEYINWLSEQSLGIIDSLKCTHFVFITYNSVLDVATTYEPKFEFIKD